MIVDFEYISFDLSGFDQFAKEYSKELEKIVEENIRRRENERKVICQQCGKEFEVYSNLTKNRKYCNQRCCGLATRSENNSNWKGENRKNYKVKSNPKRRLNNRIQVTIHRCLKKGNKDTGLLRSLIGYNVKNLKERLIATMPNGYSWQDYIESRLQIDHILAILLWEYSLSSDREFKQCWALCNLQLLPARENAIKQAKVIELSSCSVSLI